MSRTIQMLENLKCLKSSTRALHAHAFRIEKLLSFRGIIICVPKGYNEGEIMTISKSLRFEIKMIDFKGSIKSDRTSATICNQTVGDC